MYPIKLFIIDDHAVTLIGLFHVFDIEKHGIKVIGSSLSVDEAITQFPDPLPDIILLDLFIREQSPVRNLEKLKEAFPLTPIVIYSCDTSMCWQIAMFRHGVKAWASKASGPERLINIIQRVYSGEVIIPSEIGDILLTADHPSPNDRLPDDFCEMINMLSRGYRYKEISRIMRKSTSAVTKQLAHIRSVFAVNSDVELVFKFMTNRFPH